MSRNSYSERESFSPRSPPSSTQRHSRQGMAFPGAHPDSAFQQLRADRRLSRDGTGTNVGAGTFGLGAGSSASATATAAISSPPSYQQAQQRHGAAPPPQGSYYPPLSNISPERNARHSDYGFDAMDDNNNPPTPPQHAHHQMAQTAYAPEQDERERSLRPGLMPYAGAPSDRTSRSSTQLDAAALPLGQASPGYGPYTDDPFRGYSGYSSSNAPLGYLNPDEIDDDGDDGLEYGQQQRRSMLSLGGTSSRSAGHNRGTATAAAVGAGGAGAGAGVLGGLLGTRGARDGSGQYNAVQGGSTGYQGSGGIVADGAGGGPIAEKSAWLAKQGSSATKWRWIVGLSVTALVALGIGLGVYFGVVKHHSSSSSSVSSAADDTAANGDLNINSSEIKKLLNNPNLHKVFPGVDYTPINTQYPACLTDPPSQNNVTRDLAVLSQLTNTIRLYGTDCNQTEMLLTAIDRLEMNDTIRVWMGVWQDNNATTGDRQIAQMWDILEKYGDTPFEGVIVANEILFREQMTVTQLSSLLSEVRDNITAKGMSLPVATSDLGTDWTTELAEASDYVMANIHPFFGGVSADDAAAWTYSFWTEQDGDYFKSNTSKNIIAETGWPTQGGTDCGTDAVTECTNGAVASIDGLNQFMSDWVCQALDNGTQYFWFESFDEPWKIIYDNGTENWEDHWGLLTVDRVLKDGVKIPDCDGKTVD